MHIKPCVLCPAILLAFALQFAPAPAHADGPFQFHALTPCRVFDTRTVSSQTNGSPLPNPGPHLFRIQGNCGVPNGAKAVSVNVTIVAPNRQGDLRLYPANVNPGLNDPSTLNYNSGEPALANGAIVPLGPVSVAGDKDLKILIGMAPSTSGGLVHVILDVTGYFDATP
jgi:hypothetical protein